MDLGLLFPLQLITKEKCICFLQVCLNDSWRGGVVEEEGEAYTWGQENPPLKLGSTMFE